MGGRGTRGGRKKSRNEGFVIYDTSNGYQPPPPPGNPAPSLFPPFRGPSGSSGNLAGLPLAQPHFPAPHHMPMSPLVDYSSYPSALINSQGRGPMMVQPLPPSMLPPPPLPPMLYLPRPLPPVSSSPRPEDIDMAFRAALNCLNAMYPSLHPQAVLDVVLRVMMLEALNKTANPAEALVNVTISDILEKMERLFSGAGVASESKAALHSIRNGFLNGEPLSPLLGIIVKGIPGFHPLLMPMPVEIASLVAEALISASPSALEPDLSAAMPPPGGWIPLAPPAVPLSQEYIAEIAEPPPALRNFMAGSGPRMLVTKALQHLSTACRIVGTGLSADVGLGNSSSFPEGNNSSYGGSNIKKKKNSSVGTGGSSLDGSQSGGGGLTGLSISNEIDFGVQPTVSLVEEDVQQAAQAVASGGSGVLDVLVLAGTAQLSSMKNTDSVSKRQGQRHGQYQGSERIHTHTHTHTSNITNASSSAAAAAAGTSAVRTVGAVQTATLTLRNTDPNKHQEFWILGGAAAPNLPHTFAALDEARLFWQKGNAAVRLGPGQEHKITVVMCRADGPGRDAECGMLQQALLFFITVAADSTAYEQLARISGAAFRDVDPSVGPSAGNKPHRVFVAARKISVALLTEAHAMASTSLDPEAKPFISERLRQLFDFEPSTLVCDFPLDLLGTLCADLREHGFPAFVKKGSTKRANTLQALELPREVSAPSDTLRALRKYLRLLHLEESTMEVDICRHDMHGVRLQFALILDEKTRIYTVARVESTERSSSSSASYGNENGITTIYSSNGTATGTTTGTTNSTTTGTTNSTAGTSPSAPPPAPHGSTGRRLFRGPNIKALQPDGVFTQRTNKALGYALLLLTVPGLPEGRPALTIGDWVHIRFEDPKQSSKEITALVVGIDASTAFLLPPPSFWSADVAMAVQRAAEGGSVRCDSLGDGLVSVRLTCDRRPLSTMRDAVRTASILAGPTTLLVPPLDGSGAVVGMQPLARQVAALAESLQCTSRSGERLNLEQRLAVAAVVSGAGRASPYALWGPPGTGKTVTLVAMALELRVRYPYSRLLCCAPQNYSADLLCSALAAAGIPPTQMVRINDPRRPPYTVKGDVLPYSLFNEEYGMFQVPTREQLATWSVMVTTCAGAALLPQNFASPGGYFTHVLVDEAGQALLPEALIPLTLMRASISSDCDQWGAVVCGDPQQLGPVVRSPVAAAAGLSCSLLEHLVSAHSAGAPRLSMEGRTPATSMLLRNYRSSSTLLDLPSKMFYQGALVAAADPKSVLPPQWSELAMDDNNADKSTTITTATTTSTDTTSFDTSAATPTDPAALSASLLFYGVRGEQARDADVPSYYNTLEASTVAELVQGLLRSNAGVVEGDIGVMATYRRQVQLIRLMLRQKGLSSVRVGTVDDYQGQEERVIFISTVLTSAASLPSSHSDVDAQVALWRNPRRFNVAVSRAKALLVVVGHPAVLVEDACWKELVRHCVVRGAFRGAGAAAVRNLLGVDSAPSGLMGGILDGEDNDVEEYTENYDEENYDEGDEGFEDAELKATIERMAELALLGAGDAARLFPETLEEAYDAYAEETEWRVML